MSAPCVSVSDLTPDAPAPDVALLLPTLFSGGAERVQINLAQDFLRRGYRVDLVVGKYFGSLKDQVPDGVRLVSLDARRVVLSLHQYLDYLAKARPPAVLASVENISIVSCLGRWLSRHPHRLVVRLDNVLFDEFPVIRQPDRWPWLAAIMATFPAAEEIVAVSKGLRRQLHALPGYADKPARVIYNPIIRPDFAEKAALEPVLPAAVRRDRPWLVAAGRLHWQKDYTTMLRAFALAVKRVPAQLLVLGEGDDRHLLEALARELGIADDVHFLGYVENPLAVMARARAFVLSSRHEGFGNVIVEALAVGTSVISTDCPHGPAEILADGRFGSLVPVGDFEALGDAMAADLATPKPPMSEDLRRHLEQFEVGHIGDAYVDVLRLPTPDPTTPE